MPVEFDRGSPGKFDSRTLNRKTLNRWTGRTTICIVDTGRAANNVMLYDAAGLLSPGQLAAAEEAVE